MEIIPDKDRSHVFGNIIRNTKVPQFEFINLSHSNCGQTFDDSHRFDFAGEVTFTSLILSKL